MKFKFRPQYDILKLRIIGIIFKVESEVYNILITIISTYQ